MNALNSDWISSEVAERAYDAVEEAYSSVHLSLIPPILGAAAESYVDSQILEHHPDLVGPRDGNNVFCSMTPRASSESSMAGRIEYLDYEGSTPSEDLNRAQELWVIRSELLNSDYPVFSAGNEIQGRTDIENYIRDFESLIGYEGESMTETLEPGNREIEVRSGTRNREEFIEVMVSEAYASGSDELLLPAAVLAYERFTDEIDDRWIEPWIDQEYGLDRSGETTLQPTDEERYAAFENQRMLIAHNLEAFHGLEIENFSENLLRVLGDITECEGIAGDQINRWADASNLRNGPPMYKTEALFDQDNKWYP